MTLAMPQTEEELDEIRTKCKYQELTTDWPWYQKTNGRSMEDVLIWIGGRAKESQPDKNPGQLCLASNVRIDNYKCEAKMKFVCEIRTIYWKTD